MSSSNAPSGTRRSFLRECCARQFRRHHDRVVRLLSVRHRRSPGIQPPLASRTSAPPIGGLIAAFGTYAVGFLARPIGGIVAGHIGDRVR